MMFLQFVIFSVAYIVPGIFVGCVSYRRFYVGFIRRQGKFTKANRQDTTMLSILCGLLWPLTMVLSFLYLVTVVPAKKVGPYLERPVK